MSLNGWMGCATRTTTTTTMTTTTTTNRNGTKGKKTHREPETLFFCLCPRSLWKCRRMQLFSFSLIHAWCSWSICGHRMHFTFSFAKLKIANLWIISTRNAVCRIFLFLATICLPSWIHDHQFHFLCSAVRRTALARFAHGEQRIPRQLQQKYRIKY